MKSGSPYLHAISMVHVEYLSRDILFEFHLKFWNTPTSIGIPARSLL